MPPRFLLASNSPRRRKLLADAGYDFVTVRPNITEKFDRNLTLLELTAWNAFRKGVAIAHAYPESVVLAADTLVAIEDQVLGKPRSKTDAAKMLRRLSGRVHKVCSAVFICHLASARSRSFCEISRVRFRDLTEAGLRRYMKKVNVLDKAGAYAAQESADQIIAKIEGSHTNVVGLPMKKTIVALAEFGIAPNRKARSLA